MEVYPRGCGGTTMDFFAEGCNKGLSPRVRGNHGLCWAIHELARSIPAGAGEPQPAGDT